MQTKGGVWPHHRWGGHLGAHQVLAIAQNTEVGMDAQRPQLVIDGSWSVFGTGLLGLSKLSVDKTRQLGECEELKWTGMGLGFCWGWLGGGIEGVAGAMLSSIAQEVTQISQNFQKGVTKHNMLTFPVHTTLICHSCIPVTSNSWLWTLVYKDLACIVRHLVNQTKYLTDLIYC